MLSKRAEKCQHLLQTVFTGIWQSRRKSVRVNDLDDCSRRKGGRHPLVHRGSSRSGGGAGVDMPKSGCTQPGAALYDKKEKKNDIISPWKESRWKVAAAGSQLPTGGCHALWLAKYFFHWQILPPDPLFFFFFFFPALVL